MKEGVEFTSLNDLFAPAPEPVSEGPFLPAVNPAWLAPLCDAFTEKSAYIWHKLVYDGHGDLDPEPCGVDEVGPQPSWWSGEDDKSLDMIISPNWTHATYGGHEFRDQWILWGLENGLAPGQPFLVRLEPHWSRTSWEYDEWDCEWNAEVVRVMPRTPAQALRSWDRLLGQVRRYYALFVERYDRLLLLQDTDTSAYNLALTFYGRYGEGARVHLESRHTSMWGPSISGTRGVSIVSGEDDEGDYGRAFRRLIANIRKDRPRVSLPAVLALPKHRKIGITRWDVIGDDAFDSLFGVT